jgi:osmotically inducible lipoprotein OsmB
MKPSSRENIQKTFVVGVPEVRGKGVSERGQAKGGGLNVRVSGSQEQVNNRLNDGREIACFWPESRAFLLLSLTPLQRRISMRIASFALIFASLLGLAGCGSDPGTRAVTGGLLGAGAGAGVSALTGGRPATGALIGGGVGAVGGAVTH